MPKRDAAHMDARRDQILDAYMQTIRKHGIAGASIHQVAAEAGLSIGGIYVHFKGVDEILLAAVRRAVAQTRSGVLFSSLGEPHEFWKIVDGLLDHHEGQRGGNSGLNLELMLVARSDPKIRRELAANSREQAAFIARCVATLPGAGRQPAAAEALATAINALMAEAQLQALAGADIGRAGKRRAIRELVARLLPA